MGVPSWFCQPASLPPFSWWLCLIFPWGDMFTPYWSLSIALLWPQWLNPVRFMHKLLGKHFPSDPLEGNLVCSSFEKGVSWHHLCLDSNCELKARYAPGNLSLINPWIFLLFTNLDFIFLVKQEQAIWLSQESWSSESTEWLKISMYIWGSGKMVTERLL